MKSQLEGMKSEYAAKEKASRARAQAVQDRQEQTALE